jgi:signal transduction histidine kinase
MFRGKLTGFLCFLGIAALLLGGLGWATRAALRVEDDQRLAAANARAAEELFQAKKERTDAVRSALWRLDTRLTGALAREESRPYPQYAALHTPFPAMTADNAAFPPGMVFLPSPLLTCELPEWMSLHFQVDPNGWTSPQVIPEGLQQALRKQPLELALNNVTPERAAALKNMRDRFPAPSILTTFREMGVSATESDHDAQKWAELVATVNISRFNGRAANPYGNNDAKTYQEAGAKGQPAPAGPAPPAESQQPPAPRAAANPNPLTPEQLDYAYRVVFSVTNRGEGRWAYIYDDNRANMPLAPGGGFGMGVAADKKSKEYQTVDVQLGTLRPVWLPAADQPDALLMVRAAKVGGKPVYQGFAIDWPKLQTLLKAEVADLFPDARLVPLPPGEPPHPDRAMAALPVEFDPVVEPIADQPASIDPATLPPAGWTPLRIGLGIAWASVLVALLAVALGGWTLLDLSERRIRFVSAVTHELRTPLTTLRLYLDLLSSGLVTEETQKAEYLTTLNSEADRLHRLIGNVLDFARLEKSRPAVEKRSAPVSGLLDQLQRNWQERCAAAGKELVIENKLPESTAVTSDPGLVEQIVGNLIDNAQKYSRDATDPRIILRALESNGRLAIEVEDRGPGVTKGESCRIFRPFRRGQDADVKAGGVGLGLALSTRWAHLLGGKLSVGAGGDGIGACFRLELPGLSA